MTATETRGMETTRAEQIARAIEDGIVEMGWPLGRVLGSEPEFLERYDTSRSILREAIRIVEVHGVAHMRRGPGGGLVVTAPDRTAVAEAVGVWLASEGVLVSELLAARNPLLQEAIGEAVENLDAAHATKLTDLLGALSEKKKIDATDFVNLDLAIAEIGANPALELFLTALGEVLLSRLHGTRAAVVPPIDDGAGRVHLDGYRRVIRAIIKGDLDEAQARMARMQRAVGERLVDRAVRPRRSGAVIPQGDRKLGARVATAMRDDIERAGWPVGSLFGAEAELTERYGASRAVTREAVRILEHYGAVRTKRGPGGGVFITKPDDRSIKRTAELVLAHEGVTLQNLLAVRSALELEAVRRASIHCSADDAHVLRAAVAADLLMEGDHTQFHEVHRHIARLSGSRPLGLFVDVLTDLTSAHVRPAAWRADELPGVRRDVHRAHSGIVDAIIRGDLAKAQRRMERHLAATIAGLR